MKLTDRETPNLKPKAPTKNKTTVFAAVLLACPF
jgi:hypothetical protein